MKGRMYVAWLYAEDEGIEVAFRKRGKVEHHFFPRRRGSKPDLDALRFLDRTFGEKVRLEETPLGFRVFKGEI